MPQWVTMDGVMLFGAGLVLGALLVVLVGIVILWHDQSRGAFDPPTVHTDREED